MTNEGESIQLFFWSGFNLPAYESKTSWAELLEAWLALTSVKYHDNLLILMLLNQWLAPTMLRATGHWKLNRNKLTILY